MSSILCRLTLNHANGFKTSSTSSGKLIEVLICPFHGRKDYYGLLVTAAGLLGREVCPSCLLWAFQRPLAEVECWARWPFGLTPQSFSGVLLCDYFRSFTELLPDSSNNSTMFTWEMSPSLEWRVRERSGRERSQHGLWGPGIAVPQTALLVCRMTLV